MSERTGQPHLKLSDELMKRNTHYDCTLFQEKYETNDEVYEWNKMVE